MIQKQPNQVVILTPKGTVTVARRLFDSLETRLKPEDQGLLHQHDWWAQLSELVNGIQLVVFPARARQEEAHS